MTRDFHARMVVAWRATSRWVNSRRLIIGEFSDGDAIGHLVALVRFSLGGYPHCLALVGHESYLPPISLDIIQVLLRFVVDLFIIGGIATSARHCASRSENSDLMIEGQSLMNMFGPTLRKSCRNVLWMS